MFFEVILAMALVAAHSLVCNDTAVLKDVTTRGYWGQAIQEEFNTISSSGM